MQKFQMYYSTDFLVYISMTPRNNVCGPMNFPWNWAYFQKHPVKSRIFLRELGWSLHMAQLMPLPLTVSCFSKIQIGFTILVPAHLGSPGQRAVKQVCVCLCNIYKLNSYYTESKHSSRCGTYFLVSCRLSSTGCNGKPCKRYEFGM